MSHTWLWKVGLGPVFAVLLFASVGSGQQPLPVTNKDKGAWCPQVPVWPPPPNAPSYMPYWRKQWPQIVRTCGGKRPYSPWQMSECIVQCSNAQLMWSRANVIESSAAASPNSKPTTVPRSGGGVTYVPAFELAHPRIAVHPEGPLEMDVGLGIVYPTTRECFEQIEHALDAKDIVPTSDSRCAGEMNKALELQKEFQARYPRSAQ